LLEINSAALSARILPEAGGGLAGFDWHGRGESIPLMRRYEPSSNSPGQPIDPNRLACYPLVPWSNRIDNCGFEIDGRWIALTPNREGERWPIHGSGWQRAWQVQLHTASEVRLSLCESSATAYSYLATLHYALHDDALQVDLTVTNKGLATMPFGLGLHPFFPRHGDVRLLAPAPQVWVNDGQSPLPVDCIAVPTSWDFRNERVLPGEGLDHAFPNWTGDAAIHSDVDGVPRSQHGAGGLLDYPHYTRPAEFRGAAVPEVLMGGDHAAVRKWRREQQLRKTLRNRPDLLEGAALSDWDLKVLARLRAEMLS